MTPDERLAVFRAIEGGLCDDALLWFVEAQGGDREKWNEYVAMMNEHASRLVGRSVKVLERIDKAEGGSGRVDELDRSGFYRCFSNRWNVIY